MCAACTSALLSAIVKEAVKMVGSSATTELPCQKAPLKLLQSQVQQESGHNTEHCSFSSHARYIHNHYWSEHCVCVSLFLLQTINSSFITNKLAIHKLR